MNRSEFLRNSAQWACGTCAALLFSQSDAAAAETAPSPPTPVDEVLKQAQEENRFVSRWLTDLFETIEKEVDPATQLKLMEGCGRGCFRRHKFKRDIADAGRGDLQKLVEAYGKNFLVWREENRVHIAYGQTTNSCFCPAAQHRPGGPHDLHCECTRATHQTVFETALSRPFKVELIETVRRGGQRCHLVVHLT